MLLTTQLERANITQKSMIKKDIVLENYNKEREKQGKRLQLDELRSKCHKTRWKAIKCGSLKKTNEEFF